jgi:nicotinamide-nucleotide amidase
MVPTDAELNALAEAAAALLGERGLSLASAESCTGGWLAKTATDLAGSSRWFERGFVTYSNEAKQELLGVAADTLAHYGAVSEQTALEMARGALAHSRAQVSLAITGIAGPGGGSLDKPVGLVWFAWARVGSEASAQSFRFEGDREAVRRASVAAAWRGLLDRLGAP